MVMRRRMKTAVLSVLLALLCSGAAGAVETAPRISDREIIENTTPIAQLQNRGQQEMPARFDDANVQFDRNYGLILWMIVALAVLPLAAVIGFALWDWWHTPRPVRSSVTPIPFGSDEMTIEDELSRNPDKLHALLEALRPLARTNEPLAAVLRQYRLL